ncbi:hypothetical protein AB0K71_32310 [Streptomyces syringium]|uniref:hypothetical protein n=1 Tax=Streptomyces syringium TaxID=76729 RepID=UPI003416F603
MSTTVTAAASRTAYSRHPRKSETVAPTGTDAAREGPAGARAAGGHPHHAAELLGTATTLPESVDAALPAPERSDADRAAPRASAALGEDGFVAAFARGHTLTVDDHARVLGVGEVPSEQGIRA